MAYQEDIALMAHLMRRAGFGATRDELETRAAKGYEATVEELLNPDTQPPVDDYALLRYQPASLLPGGQPPMGNVHWLYYLVNTQRPLRKFDDRLERIFPFLRPLYGVVLVSAVKKGRS